VSAGIPHAAVVVSNVMMKGRWRLALASAVLALSSCAGGGPSGPAALPAADARRALALVSRDVASTKISHVVIIVQENRTFDNLFAGFPGADTQSYGYDSVGQKIPLRPVSLDTTWDLEHSSSGFIAACDGQGSFPGTDCKMDGFDKESVGCGSPGEPHCPDAHPQYSYVPHSETKPYFDMGKQYVVADRMFESNFDGSSFVSHQYLIAAQASSSVDIPEGGPWGCDGGGNARVATVTQQRQMGGLISPCFDNETLGDELDAAGLPWAFYTSTVAGDGGLWSAYQAIKHVRFGPDWKKDVKVPQTRFFSDVSQGKLRAVTWITPTCENSDHAGCGSKSGPAWVTSLVNAIGKSKYWNSTAIFIMWDDYGGWYDHVGPKLVDYDGLGFRVPLVVISAYAKKGYVSHVHYENGSLLRFIEDRFGLATLSASDARANSPERDCFDFGKPPRKFVPIAAPMTQRDFELQPPDLRPPDSD